MADGLTGRTPSLNKESGELPQGRRSHSKRTVTLCSKAH